LLRAPVAYRSAILGRIRPILVGRAVDLATANHLSRRRPSPSRRLRWPSTGLRRLRAPASDSGSIEPVVTPRRRPCGPQPCGCPPTAALYDPHPVRTQRTPVHGHRTPRTGHWTPGQPDAHTGHWTLDAAPDTGHPRADTPPCRCRTTGYTCVPGSTTSRRSLAWRRWGGCAASRPRRWRCRTTRTWRMSS
jgi:hypothetical protein